MTPVTTVEVLIIGAGPAGLAAALAAAPVARSVMILDDNPRSGGQIWRQGPHNTLPASARQLLRQLTAYHHVSHTGGAKIIMPLGHKGLLYETASGSGVVRYQRLILCCGARELLLPFPGWTLPGVTGAGALQAQLKGGLRLEGQRVALAGSGPLLLAVAQSVKQAGGEVVLIAEQAAAGAVGGFISQLWRWPAKALQALRLSHRRYRCGSLVVSAQGETRLTSIRLRQRGVEQTLHCDRLACGFGLIANTELAQLLGCELRDSGIAVGAWQQTSQPDILAAGECTGPGGSELAQLEGTIAGLAATGQHPAAQRLFARRERWQQFARRVNHAFALDDALKTLVREDTLLCRCEDVAAGEVAAEGSWVQAKLTTRCGMGACQGKVCAAAARYLYGWPLPAPRIPLAPARMATLLSGEEKND